MRAMLIAHIMHRHAAALNPLHFFHCYDNILVKRGDFVRIFIVINVENRLPQMFV